MLAFIMVLTFIMLAIAAYTDIKYGKIFWWATLPVIAFGLVWQVFNLSAADYLIRLGVIVGIYFLYEGIIGGGDAKLVMALVILHGVLPGLLTLALASLFVVAISYIKDPQKTKETVTDGLRNVYMGQIKQNLGKGPTVLLAPYMLVAFSIIAFVFGLY